MSSPTVVERSERAAIVQAQDGTMRIHERWQVPSAGYGTEEVIGGPVQTIVNPAGAKKLLEQWNERLTYDHKRARGML